MLRKRWIKTILLVALAVAVAIAGTALYRELTKKSDAMLELEATVAMIEQRGKEFNALVAKMTPDIQDVNTITSFDGKTLSEMQAIIDEKDAEINAILRKAAQENRMLSADEIGRINICDAEIVWNSFKKASLYQDVEQNKCHEIMRRKGSLTALQIEQLGIDVRAAFDQAQTVLAAVYVARLTRIETIYAAMDMVGSELYQAARQDANSQYNDMLTLNQDYYGLALRDLLESTYTLVVE